jgi:hypothetical protein
MNVTVTGSQADGYLTVWPCDQPQPNASNLNFRRGIDVPNLVTVKLADNYFAFLSKLDWVKSGITGGVAHKAHRHAKIGSRGREVVVNHFFLRLTVIDNAKLIDRLQVVFSLQ